jgi:site-specific DNA-cytosine methylase
MEDKKKRFSDILVPLEEASKHELSERGKDYMNRRSGKTQITRWERRYHNDTAREKSRCALHCMSRNVPYTALIDRRVDPPLLRRILPVEVERLQGFPDGYTSGVAKCHRLGALGNAVCAPVAVHVMQSLLRVTENRNRKRKRKRK